MPSRSRRVFLKHELFGLGLTASERVLCVNRVGYCSQRKEQGEGAGSERTAAFRGMREQMRS